ncbi:hypothetical protein [Bacillus halotolerans]
MELFWVKGFASTSKAELCKHTGIGKASLLMPWQQA